VYDKELQQDIKTVIEYGLRDNVQARICEGTGKNIIQNTGEPPFRSQTELMKYYQELEEKKKSDNTVS